MKVVYHFTIRMLLGTRDVLSLLHIHRQVSKIFHLLLSFLSLYQMTPLHLAAERARVKVIEYLVDKEADIINSEDQNGVNSIMTVWL